MIASKKKKQNQQPNIFPLPLKFPYLQHFTLFPFHLLFLPKKNSSFSSLLNMVTLN